MLDNIKPHLDATIDLEFPIQTQPISNGTLEKGTESGNTTVGEPGNVKTNINGKATFGSDVINTTRAEVPTVVQPGINNIAQSADNLTVPLSIPVANMEMNIMRADSQRGSAGFIVTETRQQPLPLQLRAKSLEFQFERL